MNIITWKTLSPSDQATFLSRAKNATSTRELAGNVSNIIETVKNTGDVALKNYTKKWDNVALDTLFVSEQNWAMVKALAPRYQQAINAAYQNIYHVHELDIPKQVSTRINEIDIQKIYRAIESVGLYIPGGTAPLLSTVLMLGIPAQLARCKKVIMITPPNQQGLINPAILYAANLCGIHDVYCVGGAQGIAALAYGTQTIPKVNKIFGPGNAYVMEAKRQVADDPNGAALDLPAGPSEVMIVADDNASPGLVAADLLAQAEHDGDAKIVLVTTGQHFASRVLDEVERQSVSLTRKAPLSQSLAAGLILVEPDLRSCFDIANGYAPEHLILHLDNPRQYLDDIQAAGSVFLGPWSAEAFGDYASGTNHVLPTAGYARTHSGLGVRDFMTSITVQEVSEAGFMALSPTVEALAELETLDGHLRSVTLRRELWEKRQ